MDIAILVIGDELLIGQVNDTNSGEIAKIISPAGWSVRSVITVGDNKGDIKSAIAGLLDNYDVVITTGGLGPTKDDITKSVLAEIFGGEMIESKDVLENVKTICEKRGIELNNLTATQTIVPTSCRVIQNRVGTAPVMWFEKDGKTLVSMPGVPFEAITMFRTEVFPQLMKKYGSELTIAHRTTLIFNVIESEIAERLSDWEKELPEGVHLAYLPTPGLVRLRLDGVGKDANEINHILDRKLTELEQIFDKNIVWSEDLPLAEIAIKLLKEKGLTLSTAESCTGGRISGSITSVPGASEVFLGSIVAYHNNAKHNLLKVSEESIATYGAVSLPVVEQMANGAADALGSQCAIATSGIAGPSGGSEHKPVGTVCIAVKTPNKIIVDHYLFPGNRERIIERATATALIKLIRALKQL